MTKSNESIGSQVDLSNIEESNNCTSDELDSVNVDLSIVNEWIEHDIFEPTKKELKNILEKALDGDPSSISYINDAFKTELTFGTAGLRGEMGPGPNRMNHCVVARAAKGLSDYLYKNLGKGYKVVIGFDARYNSESYAVISAKIIEANNGNAYIMPFYSPTPMTVYAANVLNADATIVVTASHNPAKDNGYKVYLGEKLGGKNGKGVQIVPPADKDIFALIQQAPFADMIPQKNTYQTIDNSIWNSYVNHVCEHSEKIVSTKSARQLKIVTTALHGVGGKVLNAILSKSGFENVYNVEEQQIPDPNFPTLDFPNPEENGALDLAIALAKKKNADIILANDPDADRCSVAIKEGKTYRQLNGDEIGCLLGNIIASNNKNTNAVLANSIVSSRLLALIAKSHNINHTETLTGFKWIARSEKMVFGYEEAIGFCVDPENIRDKDGLSACLIIAKYADALKDHAKSLQDILDIFALRFGLYHTGQLSIRVEEPDIIAKALKNIKVNPPKVLANSKVVKIVDLENNPESDLPPTVGFAFYTASNDRIIIRPSGTEPKLKCYIETIVPPEIVAPAYFSMHSMRNPMLQALGRIQDLKINIRKSLGI